MARSLRRRIPSTTPSLANLRGCSHRIIPPRWRYALGDGGSLAVRRSGALVLGTIEDAELQHVHGLMSRYWERPMDFADGTLVYLAKREFLSVILTVDHADFATYRIEGKRQFRVLPASHP
jgi:hypothetical protein